MFNLRFLLTAARVIAVVIVIGLLVKVGPVIATHAAGHSGTYAAGSVPAPAWPLTRGSR
jgi:hypothetical protein